MTENKELEHNDQLNENSTKYHMLKASVLLDRLLNKNTRYYDMHGIVTTRVMS